MPTRPSALRTLKIFVPRSAHSSSVSGARPAKSSRSATALRSNATSRQAMSRFQGSSEEDLRVWLEENSVDTSAYGTGPHKSLQDLLLEVEKGETRLYALDGHAERRLSVLNLLVSTSGSDKVLKEDFQALPSGAVRRRGLPLSEKLLPEESWQDAVRRAITEELGSVLQPNSLEYDIDHAQYRKSEESWISASYPQLRTISTHHTVPVRVEALPKEGFSTVEGRPGGELKTHWIWVAPETFD